MRCMGMPMITSDLASSHIFVYIYLNTTLTENPMKVLRG